MRQFGTYSVGERGEFLVYPDGPGGSEIRVEFEMQPEMISGSTQARSVVEIRDQRV